MQYFYYVNVSCLSNPKEAQGKCEPINNHEVQNLEVPGGYQYGIKKQTKESNGIQLETIPGNVVSPNCSKKMNSAQIVWYTKLFRNLQTTSTSTISFTRPGKQYFSHTPH